ncbi:unnamed protein product [Echinostoma caproni]|uniref:Gag-pol polyprotein n=1 Tax=Echinostoma caproni TaxID=27848 RepID=A0A183BDW8_9TREM|nr:unnamed protein product [Echinostoma caproni]
MSEFSSPATQFPQFFGPFAEVEAKLETASPYKRIPPLTTPEKFVPGDDFDVWESQVRRYVRKLPPTYRANAVINFLSREAYTLVMDFDLPDDVDTLLVTLRR